MSLSDVVAEYEWLVYQRPAEEWADAFLCLYAAAESFYHVHGGQGDFERFAKRWIALTCLRERALDAGCKYLIRDGRSVLVRRHVAATDNVLRWAGRDSTVVRDVVRRLDPRPFDLSVLTGTFREVAEMLARRTTPAEVAAILGLTTDQVYDIRRRIAKTLRLEAPGRRGTWTAGRLRGPYTSSAERVGVPGVYFVKRLGKWKAEVATATQRHYLGLFDLPELAAAAVRAKRAELGLVDGPLKGERNAAAKLTASQVEEIRQLVYAGQHTDREIGIRFGVSRRTIAGIRRGQTWQSLTGASDAAREVAA